MLTDSAGYSYTIKREGKKISTWRCSVRSKALWCRATVVQKGDDFTPGPLEHQHPSSAGITTATKVRAAMKDRCVGDMFTSAKTIVNNVLKDIRKSPEEPIDALQGPDLLERILNRFRAGHRPTDPKSLDFELDLNWVPANFLQKDIRGEDYRHIVFATEEMLHLLSISKVWYIDATFKVISKPFTQLWSIHAFVKHGEACKQIPLAFVMMSGKRTLDYKMVLEAINDILPTEANVLRFVMDFEMGEWQAVATVYPHAECMGCGFHWVQCLWRKIQELGLVIAYRDDAATRQYCRRLMALLFLPSEHIVDMFRQLRAKAMTVPLAKLTTYMFETWIVNRTWTPASWSVYNQLVRTNNDVEGWHAMLNRAAKRGSLQLYVLVELLHQQAENVDLQVRLVHGEKLTRRQRVTYRKIQDKLCKAWEGYRSSNMTNKDAKKLLDTCTDLMAP